jgi:hypothetical protein
MSSYSSRQHYDYKATIEATDRSTKQGLYRLNTDNGYNCNTCYAPFGPYGVKGAPTALSNAIDVDSILRGYTKIHSKSNEDQMPDSLDPYHNVAPKDCSPFIEPEYSRFTNPIQTYRGITRDPFYRLHHDPQCHVFWNFSENTQLTARDSHIPEWRVPLE